MSTHKNIACLTEDFHNNKISQQIFHNKLLRGGRILVPCLTSYLIGKNFLANKWRKFEPPPFLKQGIEKLPWITAPDFLSSIFILYPQFYAFSFLSSIFIFHSQLFNYSFLSSIISFLFLSTSKAWNEDGRTFD